MGEQFSSAHRDRRFRNRVQVTRGHRPISKCDVTLRAGKRRILISLIDFVVENSTFIQRRGNVTTLRASTRFHRHLLRRVTRGVHRRHVVTLRAFQIGMCLMSKSAGRSSIAPRSQRRPVGDADPACKLLIKICCVLFVSGYLVTRVAARGQRRELALLVMTREASRVSDRSRLESSFLQPECITDVFGWLGDEFIIRFSLRPVGLMTVGTIRIRVFVVWKKDTKL